LDRVSQLDIRNGLVFQDWFFKRIWIFGFWFLQDIVFQYRIKDAMLSFVMPAGFDKAYGFFDGRLFYWL